jgi:hypothetical protein
VRLIRASLAASLGTAFWALLAFGTLHAVWIVPIWSRLLGGLPFTLVGALAVGWVYAEFLSAERLPRPALIGGLAFGFGAWIALLPATAASTILRLTGVHNSHASLSSAVELATAILTGFLIGRGLHAGKRPVLASMLALGTLLSVQAGPVPVANGWRSFGLFLLLAPLYAACGAMQAVFTGWLATRRPPESGRAAV